MPSLRTRLTQLFSESFSALGLEPRFGEVTLSDRPDLAHFQCNGAMAAAKSQKKNPREVAQAVLNDLQARSEKAFGPGSLQFSLAGPGFINVLLSDRLLSQEVQAMAADPRQGVEPVAHPRQVVIDYGGPNVAKAMHVGHLRGSIIGESLVRIHRFLGEKVVGDNHLGDWGLPMGMIICELRKRKPELPYFDSKNPGPFPAEPPVTLEDLEEIYPYAAKLCKEDEAARAEAIAATEALQKGTHPGYRALWQHFVNVTVKDLTRNFGALDIHFDCHLGESFYEDKMPAMIAELKARGQTEISDGALTIPLASEQDPDLPPLILEKSGGGYLYHTSDLATVQYRVDHFKADLVLYLVDKRQSMHFKQVFLAAKKTGLAGKAQLVHTAFGTMNGPDGKPFKTREGGVLKLKDLILMVEDEAKKRLNEMAAERNYSPEELDTISRQVGIATLKYADLKNNRSADYIFDLKRFSEFEGNTGPYLLYAAVRIQSILKKAADLGYQPGEILPPIRATEKTLHLECLKLPEAISRAHQLWEPHHLADFGYGLSQAFSSFYKECHIMNESDAARRASWLGLCKLVHAQLSRTLNLLGIEIPARM